MSGQHHEVGGQDQTLNGEHYKMSRTELFWVLFESQTKPDGDSLQQTFLGLAAQDDDMNQKVSRCM